MEARTILTESGGLPDSASGWKRYLSYLAVLAEEEARLRQKKFGRLSRGWVVGSAEFKAELTKELKAQAGEAERFALIGADRDGQREMRAEVWEEKLRAAAKLLGIALDTLPEQKSAREKVQFGGGVESGDVRVQWLAGRMAGHG